MIVSFVDALSGEKLFELSGPNEELLNVMVNDVIVDPEQRQWRVLQRAFVIQKANKLVVLDDEKRDEASTVFLQCAVAPVDQLQQYIQAINASIEEERKHAGS